MRCHMLGHGAILKREQTGMQQMGMEETVFSNKHSIFSFVMLARRSTPHASRRSPYAYRAYFENSSFAVLQNLHCRFVIWKIHMYVSTPYVFVPFPNAASSGEHIRRSVECCRNIQRPTMISSLLPALHINVGRSRILL
jgi:hypothetical protein